MADKAKSAMKAPASQLSEVKKKKEKPPEKPTMLHEGQVIAAQSGNNYVVERLLGRGGFGEVHKVYTTAEPDKMFAMKVEGTKCKPGHESMLRLKIELHVFDTIAAATTIDKNHFVKMQDKGKTADFKFYVMDIIWLSLKEVIEDICKNVIGPATMINIARQTLEGIDALHQLGFLHRDIKAANYAVGLPPKESIIYLLDFGIARPYKDEKTGAVKMPRARVPFMGTPRYASIRSLENLEQCRKDDLEVWMYMMLELYDKKNLTWIGETDRKKILLLKYELQNHAKEHQKSGKLKVPEGYVNIISKIKDMGYNDKGDFQWFDRILDTIVKKENINIAIPFEWVGKKAKSPVKPKSTIKKVEPSGTANSPAQPKSDWDTMITFDPPKYVTYKPIPERQKKEVTISNSCDRAVTYKMKTVRKEVFCFRPVFFIIPPNTKKTIKVTYKGEGTKPPGTDKIVVDMMMVPDAQPDMATKVWKDKQMAEALAHLKRRKVLRIHFEGSPIPSDPIPSDPIPTDKNEDESEKKGEAMKTGRKKESKKIRKASRNRDEDSDRDEVVITMEALKHELMKKKRRNRDRTRDKTREKTRDEYWRDEDEDDEDSEDDYSDDDEEYRRRRKRGRKKRSREITAQTDYSDRSDRDERDDRDDRRGRRRGSHESRKRAIKKNYEEDEEKSGQQNIDAKGKRDEKKSDTTDTSKKKDDKTPEKGAKKDKSIASPQPDDGAYMVLGDANEMEKAADLKEKMEGEAKKEQKSAAAKPEPEKKAGDAAPPAKK